MEETNGASSESAPQSKFRIWIDADACPVAIKEILYRAAKRLKIETVLVANQKISIPHSDLFRLVLVPSGADKADQKIVELMGKGDIVVTADIPLASLAIGRGGVAVGPRGELFDENSIGERLAVRNMMDQMRASGIETRGPKPLNSKDVQAFANVLDRILTKSINSNKESNKA